MHIQHEEGAKMNRDGHQEDAVQRAVDQSGKAVEIDEIYSQETIFWTLCTWRSRK